MFAWWGRTVYQYRYIVIGVMVALCLGGGLYGASLGQHVTQSGFYDETSESVHASLLADEVYERIYYDGKAAPSILRLCTRDDAVIVTQSFSKTYCMTGWRLGWITSRRDVIAKAKQLNEFFVSCAPAMVQRAGIAALQHGEDEVAAMVAAYAEQMSFCYEALSSTRRVSLAKPDGAFYLFAHIEGVENSFDYAVELLKATKVSVSPGSAFGNGGEGSLRLCFASDMSILEPAMERMTAFIEKG